MNPEYLRALDLQTEWALFHERHGRAVWTEAERGAVEQGGIIARRVDEPLAAPPLHTLVSFGAGHAARILGDGDVYYLAPDLMRLALGAAASLPDVTFDLSLLPSPHGFVVLGEPLELARELIVEAKRVQPDRAFAPMFATVMGWTSSPYATGPSGLVASGAAEFMFFGDWNAPRGPARGAVPGYWPYTYFGVAGGETWREKQSEYEHRALGSSGEMLARLRPHEIAFAFSLLLLMDQRLLVARSERPDRGHRRRAARAGRPDRHCKVIALRRYAERGPSTDAEHREVEWACQWAVRGHWRQQRYGPGLAYSRPIRILPFTKGPPGLPFRDDDARRLFAVVR